MKPEQPNLNLAPRPELARFEPYQAGLSIEQIKRQFGLKAAIKLASNENPLGPSPRGVAAYKKAAASLFRYPDGKSTDLRHVVAERHRVDYSEVIVGAGSDEIIELLAKAYLAPGDDIVISASAFVQYRSAGDLMGANVVVVPMREMKHDLEAMAAAVTERTKLLFIANPNNPTGTYVTRDEVERFLAALPPTVLPVFDEAYFEYASVHADYPSVVRDFSRKRAVMALRTFSKIYGLAGVRVGYGIGPDSVIKTLDRIRPPFNVSIPAQMAAHAAIFDEAHVKRSVALNEKEKAFLTDEIRRVGFDVVPSAANFLLIDVSPHLGKSLFDQLLQKGIIARSVNEYGLPHFLRVTVGRRVENKAFLKALREVASNQ